MFTFDEARQYLLSKVQPQDKTVRVAVAQALGRVLAADVYAQCDMPPQANSAMDGFAVRVADVALHRPLPVTQKIFAGSPAQALQAGTAARLFTGSVVPAGADAVVLQEDCSYTDTQVTINEMPEAGQHIRSQGEDIRQGMLLLAQGTCLQPRQIGYLVAGGIADVAVWQPLRVGLLATGDELREPGSRLETGQIYNANLYLLQAELQTLGFVVDARHVGDDVQVIEEAFAGLAEHNDVLLSIGGVSVGEADFVKQAIGRLGELQMWKVAMKPGKPLSYGKVSGKPVIGLPGNPVSAFATFHLFAKPYLLAMQGQVQTAAAMRCYPLLLSAPVQLRREEFMRVQLQLVDGEEWLVPYAQQGSGVLGSVVWAHGFARIASERQVCSGERVPFYPF